MTNPFSLSPGTPQAITLESIALSMSSPSQFAPTATFARDTHVPSLLGPPGQVRARNLSRQDLHDILTAALAIIEDSSDFSDCQDSQASN
jgi:hypothetical protein